jgi:hypothetical protein
MESATPNKKDLSTKPLQEPEIPVGPNSSIEKLQASVMDKLSQFMNANSNAGMIFMYVYVVHCCNIYV